MRGSYWFQSTLPRGERRLFYREQNSHKEVSIHAPTRGATFFSGSGTGRFLVSIHAPTRGATTCMDILYSVWPVSIHAPTRGATCVAGAALFYTRFQSTLPRGERHTGYIFTSNTPGFQSTLPRGERRFCTWILWYHPLFQSTLPRGERQE